MNIKLAELIDAMDFVSVATFENKAYLHKATGKIYWQSDEDFGFEALPDDIGNEDYLEIPSNYDFGLGKPLVMKFVYEFLPDSASEVQTIFRKQAGSRYFCERLLRPPCRSISKNHATALAFGCPSRPASLVCLPNKGIGDIVTAMTRRDFGQPAFSLRKKRFVKTQALSLLGTTRLLSRSGRVCQV
ncbi:hypothetical protein JCM14076_08410 [Methylosoma difficile]